MFLVIEKARICASLYLFLYDFLAVFDVDTLLRGDVVGDADTAKGVGSGSLTSLIGLVSLDAFDAGGTIGGDDRGTAGGYGQERLVGWHGTTCWLAYTSGRWR